MPSGAIIEQLCNILRHSITREPWEMCGLPADKPFSVAIPRPHPQPPGI